MTHISADNLALAPSDKWLSYDDFADVLADFRLPSGDLTGQALALTLSDGSQLQLAFEAADRVLWSGSGVIAAPASSDPYDAVQVRDGVWFVNLPLTSRERESVTVIYSTTTNRAIVAHSAIQAEAQEDVPQVTQQFWSAVIAGAQPTGDEPAPTRDLIGRRAVYRYSPSHLYEHVYMSSERYMWQCLQGEQRGHGDVDLATMWKFDTGLYLFCFREFKIPVASVWLHDLGYQLRTTGIFLGLTTQGEAEHARGGGYIYPLGSVTYPDVQPI
jgi:hypothetical protein